jgi:hypothetical protein
LKLDKAAVLAKLSCLEVQLKGLKSDSRMALWWRHVCLNARQVKLRGYYTIVPLKCGLPRTAQTPYNPQSFQQVTASERIQIRFRPRLPAVH